MSFVDSPNVLRRPRGTILNDSICDYTPESGTKPSVRKYFEIHYNVLGLGVPDSEFDITQYLRSSSLPSMHINDNSKDYNVLGLVAHIRMCWDQDPLMESLWTIYVLKWPVSHDSYTSLIGFLYLCLKFLILSCFRASMSLMVILCCLHKKDSCI